MEVLLLACGVCGRLITPDVNGGLEISLNGGDNCAALYERNRGMEICSGTMQPLGIVITMDPGPVTFERKPTPPKRLIVARAPEHARLLRNARGWNLRDAAWGSDQSALLQGIGEGWHIIFLESTFDHMPPSNLLALKIQIEHAQQRGATLERTNLDREIRGPVPDTATDSPLDPLDPRS